MTWRFEKAVDSFSSRNWIGHNIKKENIRPKLCFPQVIIN